MGTFQSFCICLFLIVAVATEEPQPTVQGRSSSGPRLTGCFSRELMTFRCHWDAGSFQNLTEPGDLRLFYMLKIDSKTGDDNWKECPSYNSTLRDNECFFDSPHTFIWFSYVIQLRSRAQDVVYDQVLFNVEDIVFPDPPEALNWTLLSVAPTGLIYDAVVSWEPPTSAADNVRTGWMSLWYETQFREKGSEQWKSLDNGKDTQAYIYGLNTSTEYEVRVRSKMRGYNFGEFSDSIFIQVYRKESRVPIPHAVLIFAVVGIGMILMLIVISRQQKLMVIFLPPVPGPKIKGIDPVLLQKGQLTEFTSILGTHPALRPDLYSNDPWVEFIEVDIDEPIETLECFETPLLLGDSPVSDSPPMSSSFRDDDSGRASCCDPDLSDHDHTEVHQPSTSGHDGFHTLSPANSGPPQEPAWPASMYSQVSDVTPRGEPVLSPEKHSLSDSCSNPDKDKAHKNEENEKGKKPLMMMIVSPDERGYTSELNTGKTGAQLSDRGQSKPDDEDTRPSAEQRLQNPLHEYQCKSIADSETTPSASPFPILTIPSPPEYTMVDGVDWKNSLLLKPNSPASNSLNVVKSLPNPGGYLTPDLLHSISPK
ncbi:growth hormone receptor-like [Astyanax mexicanus]|uniref:Growth hormone receptor-like n=2 Tax=Astyanax mexicanus TaxID=7994 RepID=A0A8T2L1D7_ASTMX|nr:growth hormone receptor-like [Astyanax mexicanus]